MNLFLFKSHLPSFLCHLIDNSTISNTSVWTVVFINFSMTFNSTVSPSRWECQVVNQKKSCLVLTQVNFLFLVCYLGPSSPVGRLGDSWESSLTNAPVVGVGLTCASCTLLATCFLRSFCVGSPHSLGSLSELTSLFPRDKVLLPPWTHYFSFLH